MLTDDELFEKCINGDDITCEDLGINPNLANCHTTIECGFRTFYTDGINVYDVNGNPASEKDMRKYNLYDCIRRR